MDMHLSNEMKMNQKLIITPQMKQYMKILQMNQQELRNYVEQQALENPVMETEPDYNTLEYPERLKKKLDWLESIDEENRIYYQTSRESDEFEHTFISEDNNDLQQYLLSQLKMLSLSELDDKIARYIIQSLNEHGYLEGSLEEIAQILHISQYKVEEILKIIQSLEPPGVGARNLQECLIIQLKSKGIQDPNLFLIIYKYLPELGKNRLNAIAKELGISIDEVKKYCNMIKALNPYPGNTFSSARHIRYINPDIVVVKFKDYYQVLLNDLAYPKVSISNYYRDVLNTTNDNKVKEYISNKIEQASCIIRCIEKRNNTLLNISKVIVDIQKEYFDKGPLFLVPMTLKNIADALSIHESTISRAIHGKYLQSPWGTVEMKYFFSSGYSKESNYTCESIKLLIKEILQSEDKRKPYSDQKISDILKQKGVRIARRTVTKYREEMNIPAASGRKQF
ncbi:MAG: RNA polymerase factor sigma-54 [Clostridiaceae bacterium]|nr:RNA polymerase factor sigma-54 [Clostridiaceae bacterium]